MPIFDQGYQHWSGTLSGHGWRWLAVARHGVRVQLRSWMIRILLIIAWLPAILLVVALALWGLLEQGNETIAGFARFLLPQDAITDPSSFRSPAWTVAFSIFFKIQIFFIMFLVLAAGPNLVSRDLRFNALPLYLSRPLNRLDYFAGKLGVVAALVALVAVLPAVVAYFCGVAFSLDLGVVRATWKLIPATAAYGLLVVASAGVMMLALSSLSRRSLYVGIAWFGFWVIGAGVSEAFVGAQRIAIMDAILREEGQGGLFAAHRPPPPPPPPPGAEKGGRRRGPGGPPWGQKVQARIERELGEAEKDDWRRLFSYTNNLKRLGDGLLGADAAWVEYGAASEKDRRGLEAMFQGFAPPGAPEPPPSNERRYADQNVLQYPWTWSAAVLAALLGLSLWTLTTRVKSLDRLK